MIQKKKFFTAGPAELYPKYNEFLEEFVNLQLGSLSHRSSSFIEVYNFTQKQLKLLMNIPDEHQIMFLGSASEIWEKSIQSLVEFETFHLINGSFSDKYYKYAQALNKKAEKYEKPLGQGFRYSEIEVPEYAEMICITQNETSTGVQMREPDIQKLKRSHASKLFSVDMVSSAPIPDLDFNIIDSAFFSVQKNFGMPAGLGVWIANEKCMEKALVLKNKNINRAAHHDLPTLWNYAQKNQTPSTPNVMGIYTLGKIAEDMNKAGIDSLRKTNASNAKLIYDYFEKKDGYSLFVEDPDLRSKTVAVINTPTDSGSIINQLEQKGFIIGSGYGANKHSQIRISNFISNSKEDIQELLHHFDHIKG